MQNAIKLRRARSGASIGATTGCLFGAFYTAAYFVFGVLLLTLWWYGRSSPVVEDDYSLTFLLLWVFGLIASAFETLVTAFSGWLSGIILDWVIARWQKRFSHLKSLLFGLLIPTVFLLPVHIVFWLKQSGYLDIWAAFLYVSLLALPSSVLIIVSGWTGFATYNQLDRALHQESH